MSRVLIVEDELPIVNMYRFKLELADYSVATAANGQEGLALAKSFAPDLILLDLRMPVMTGEEMLAELRSSDWGYGIPVIILTNISKHEAPAQLRFFNVDRYIIKAHHTPAQVVSIVNEVLGPPKSAK